MGFKSKLKGQGSDRWWESKWYCDEMISARWGEPGVDRTKQKVDSAENVKC